MSSSAINALMSLGASVPVNSANSANSASTRPASARTEDAPDQHFSQLLHDSGHHASEGDKNQQSVRGNVQKASPVALTAQEMIPEGRQLLAELVAAKDAVVQPEQAKVIVAQIDMHLRQPNVSPEEVNFLGKMKALLQNIAQGKQAPVKTLGQIIESVPEIAVSKSSPLQVVALLMSKKVPNDSQTNTSEEEAPTSAAVVMQSWMATPFRATDGAHSIATGGAAKEEKGIEKTTSQLVAQGKTLITEVQSRAAASAKLSELILKKKDEPKLIEAVNASDVAFAPVDANKVSVDASSLPAQPSPTATEDVVTMVEPLTNITQITVPQPVPVATAAQAVEPISKPVDAVQDIDTLIPPLSLKNSDAQLSEAHLPEVSLPVLRASAEKVAEKNQQVDSATQVFVAVNSDVNKPEKQAITTDKTLGNMVSLLNPSHTNGHSPTQTATAIQPANVIPSHGFFNNAPIAEQVKVAIHQANKDGIEKIMIQLDPVNLGRVEVSMHTNREGHTTISFMVDKPETFDSLSRDARVLERSLQESGIKSDAGNMQFNLRQQPQPQMQSGLGGQGNSQSQAHESEEKQASATVAPIAIMPTNYLLNVRDGIDISA